MRSRMLLTAMVGLLLGAGVCAVVVAKSQPPGAVEALPCLRFEPDTLDLGTVPSGRSPRVQVRLRNCSARPLQDVEISASCGCMAVSPNRLTLPPGEGKTVTFTISPRSADQTETLYAYLEGARSPLALARTHVQVLTIVRGTDTAGGDRRELGVLSRWTSNDASAAIGLSLPVDPLVKPIRVLRAPQWLDLEQEDLKQGEVSWSVRSLPGAPEGEFEERVELEGDTTLGKSRQVLTFAARVVSQLRTEPSVLHAGTLSRGAPPRLLQCTVIGPGVEKARATPEGSGLKLVSDRRAPGTLYLTVEVTPRTSGEYRAGLDLLLPGGRKSRVPVYAWVR